MVETDSTGTGTGRALKLAGLAVLSLAALLVLLAVALWIFAPARLDLVPLAAGLVAGAILTLVLVLLGRLGVNASRPASNL